MKNISELFATAAELTIETPQGGAGNSKLSLSIICSRKNGKRTQISKSLRAALQIGNYCELKPANANTLLIGRNLGIPGVLSCKVQDDEGRGIMYNTACVLALINYFQLDFTGRTSRSFDKITLDFAPNGEPVAIIEMNGGGSLVKVTEDVEEGAEADAPVSDEDIVFDDDADVIDV